MVEAVPILDTNVVGYFDNWKTSDGKSFIFLNLSTNEDVLTYYSKDDVTGFEFDDDVTLTLKTGWNILIAIMGEDHSVFDGTIEDLYEQGFKWYLIPQD
jgi:hypothetical protein